MTCPVDACARSSTPYPWTVQGHPLLIRPTLHRWISWRETFLAKRPSHSCRTPCQWLEMHGDIRTSPLHRTRGTTTSTWSQARRTFLRFTAVVLRSPTALLRCTVINCACYSSQGDFEGAVHLGTDIDAIEVDESRGLRTESDLAAMAKLMRCMRSAPRNPSQVSVD
jgi:hypothetical protein